MAMVPRCGDEWDYRAMFDWCHASFAADMYSDGGWGHPPGWLGGGTEFGGGYGASAEGDNGDGSSRKEQKHG
jgi:hypothetical protein